MSIVAHPTSLRERPALARSGQALRRHRVVERRQRMAGRRPLSLARILLTYWFRRPGEPGADARSAHRRPGALGSGDAGPRSGRPWRQRRARQDRRRHGSRRTGRAAPAVLRAGVPDLLDRAARAHACRRMPAADARRCWTPSAPGTCSRRSTRLPRPRDCRSPRPATACMPWRGPDCGRRHVDLPSRGGRPCRGADADARIATAPSRLTAVGSSSKFETDGRAGRVSHRGHAARAPRWRTAGAVAGVESDLRRAARAVPATAGGGPNRLAGDLRQRTVARDGGEQRALGGGCGRGRRRWAASSCTCATRSAAPGSTRRSSPSRSRPRRSRSSPGEVHGARRAGPMRLSVQLRGRGGTGE